MLACLTRKVPDEDSPRPLMSEPWPMTVTSIGDYLTESGSSGKVRRGFVLRLMEEEFINSPFFPAHHVSSPLYVCSLFSASFLTLPCQNLRLFPLLRRDAAPCLWSWLLRLRPSRDPAEQLVLARDP